MIERHGETFDLRISDMLRGEQAGCSMGLPRQVHQLNTVSFHDGGRETVSAPEPWMLCCSFRKASMRRLVELLLRAMIRVSTVSGAPESELSPIVHVMDPQDGVEVGKERA